MLMQASPHGQPANPRVLIVDGNTERRRFLQALLRSWQYEAITAYDGYSGLRRIMNDRPDVLLVDGDLNGWPPSTVIDGAARLGSRALVVMLSKLEPDSVSRLSRRSIVGMVDGAAALDDLRLLITAALEKLGCGWTMEPEPGEGGGAVPPALLS